MYPLLMRKKEFSTLLKIIDAYFEFGYMTR